MLSPTDEQISAIGKIADEFSANCSHFKNHKEVCNISILYNDKNLEDRNIAVVTNTIYKLNEDNRPLTMTINQIIEPSGNIIDMSDFMTPEEQAEYLAKLTKLEMNK